MNMGIAEYDPKNDLLDEEFMLRGKWYQRKDVEIVNGRGDVLQCSHYMPIVRPEGKALPCVIYCHGNSGCRTDASEAAIILLPSNITVFTLDFSGSGLSGGEHVTLGWNELTVLIAICSLMYGVEDPSIAGMVLDSPFSDLVDLMMELVDTYKVRLPKFTVKFAIQYMRRAILKKAKFDISELNTIKVAKSCFVPVLLGHAVDDDFIQPHHSDRIFDVYVVITRIALDPAASSTEDAINQLRSKRPMSRMEVSSSLCGFLAKILNYWYRGCDRSSDFREIKSSAKWSSDLTRKVLSIKAVGPVESGVKFNLRKVPSDMSCQDNHQSEAQEEGSGTKPVPSSSEMISFEFANGHPSGPHVSSSADDDDDDYVEYPLDNLADFPSNVEEEERMLMEAVLESLKDLDTRKPRLPDEPSSTETDPNKPSQREKPDESTITDHRVSNGPNLASELTSLDTSGSSMEPSSETALSIVESRNIGVSANSEISPDIKSSSNTDTSDHTKATVTVERNPPNNMIEGLMRRWDFNFFRNNR
ncbi:hypothetical protein RHGRI_012411 [Rhododendron griersonianum]|uniref:Serine aminopeptidase S33 domain-containing protein n=1 Tax=Rhododendron griersonianum TaxID=479676 RepID=A0AAV6KQZ3_9ERIC|nr:hypothetical protein RHGRI_012411 [Rhododendron griersonianum]